MEEQTKPKSNILARLSTLIAALFSMGVPMTEEEKTALGNAEKAVTQGNDAFVKAFEKVAEEHGQNTPPSTRSTKPDVNADLQVFVNSLQEEKRNTKIQEWVTEGRLTPAMAEQVKLIYVGNTEAVEKLMAEMPVLASHAKPTRHKSEKGTVSALGVATKLSAQNADNSDLDALAQQWLRANSKEMNSVNYALALKTVASENPELVNANVVVL